MFWQKYETYQSILSENFQLLEVKFSIYLNGRVFVMVSEMFGIQNHSLRGMDAL